MRRNHFPIFSPSVHDLDPSKHQYNQEVGLQSPSDVDTQESDAKFNPLISIYTIYLYTKTGEDKSL